MTSKALGLAALLFVFSLTALAPSTPLARPEAASSQRLSAHEKAIIKHYTQRGYFISNAIEDIVDAYGMPALNGPMIPESDDESSIRTLSYVKQLNGALDKIPSYGVPGTTEVYRGIYHESEEPIEKRFYEGKVWISRRYSSSTTSLKVATDFAMGAYKNEGCGGCDSSGVRNPDPKKAVVLTIVSLTGKEISKLAADPGEKEVLFKPGIVFKVESARRDSKGRYLVRLIELDPKKLTAADKKSLLDFETKRAEEIIQRSYRTSVGDRHVYSPDRFIADMKRANALNERLADSKELDVPVSLEEEGGD